MERYKRIILFDYDGVADSGLSLFEFLFFFIIKLSCPVFALDFLYIQATKASDIRFTFMVHLS